MESPRSHCAPSLVWKIHRWLIQVLRIMSLWPLPNLVDLLTPPLCRTIHLQKLYQWYRWGVLYCRRMACLPIYWHLKENPSGHWHYSRTVIVTNRHQHVQDYEDGIFVFRRVHYRKKLPVWLKTNGKWFIPSKLVGSVVTCKEAASLNFQHTGTTSE